MRTLITAIIALALAALAPLSAQQAQNRFPRMVAGNLLRTEGANLDIGALTVDRLGRIYVVGTVPADAATIPAATFRRTGAKNDLFVARFNAPGTALEYLAVIGGSENEQPRAIAVDNLFRVAVVGWTTSTAIPAIPTPPTAALNIPGEPGPDVNAFLLTLNAQGNQILGTTIFGGNDEDVATAVAMDSGGNVFIGGYTQSQDFPTTEGAFQRAYGGARDGFILKTNIGATNRVFSTYIGGPAPDEISALVVDSLGAPIVAGNAGSYPGAAETDVNPALPITPGSFGPKYQGSKDAFLLKLNPQGSGVVFAGYLGGEDFEFVAGLRQDADGNLILAGTTFSVANRSNIFLDHIFFPIVPAPEPGAPRHAYRDTALFVSRISADGQQLLFSQTPRLVGGFAQSLDLDTSGNMVVAGASPYSFPQIPGDFVTNSNLNAYIHPTVLAFSPTDASLVYGTRVPGSGGIAQAAVAPDGTVHVGSYASRNDVPLGPATATPPTAQRSANLGAYVASVRFTNATPCAPSLSGLPDEMNPAGGQGTLTIQAEPACPWEILREGPTDNPSIFQFSYPAAGLGSGTVTFTYPPNNSQGTRFHQLATSVNTFYWQQLSTGCVAPSFTPAALALPANGGSSTITVNLPRGCPQTIQSNTPWLSANADLTGTGTFTATLTATANPGLARVGTLTSGTSTLPVYQQSAGACAITFTPGSIQVGPNGGTVNVPFQLFGQGCSWSAAFTESWATIASGGAGSGSNGTVQLLVQPFAANALRRGSLIINGEAVRMQQLGFDETLPAEVRAVSGAATFSVYDLAAGGLATVFGNQLALTTEHAASLPLPTSLGGIRLMVKLPNGSEVAAPLLYVSPGQINFHIPEAALGATQVRIDAGARGSNTYTADVQALAPRFFEIRNGGLFVTAAGYAQLVYPDGRQTLTPLDQCIPGGDCFRRPVDRGPKGSELYLVLFGTGFPADATLEEYAGPAAQRRFTVQYAGRHPDYVGVQQINIHIPRDVFISGTADIDVTVRGVKTHTHRVDFAPIVD